MRVVGDRQADGSVRGGHVVKGDDLRIQVESLSYRYKWRNISYYDLDRTVQLPSNSMMRGRVMSWLFELGIGAAAGILSGVFLQVFFPANSGISSSAIASGAQVNQQVMVSGGDAISIVGSGNRAHIGDVNSFHVTVNERVGQQESNSDDVGGFVIVCLVVTVVVAWVLLRNYESILRVLIGVSAALLALCILMVGLALRARYVSPSLGAATFMSILMSAVAYVSYYTCFTLKTATTGLSMPDLSRLLAESSEGGNGTSVGTVVRILLDEGALAYVGTVFIQMLISVLVGVLAVQLLLRECCERYMVGHRGGGVVQWVSEHLTVSWKRSVPCAVILLVVSIGLIFLFRWIPDLIQ
jgi:membrane protein